MTDHLIGAGVGVVGGWVLGIALFYVWLRHVDGWENARDDYFG